MFQMNVTTEGHSDMHLCMSLWPSVVTLKKQLSFLRELFFSPVPSCKLDHKFDITQYFFIKNGVLLSCVKCRTFR